MNTTVLARLPFRQIKNRRVHGISPLLQSMRFSSMIYQKRPIYWQCLRTNPGSEHSAEQKFFGKQVYYKYLRALSQIGNFVYGFLREIIPCNAASLLEAALDYPCRWHQHSSSIHCRKISYGSPYFTVKFGPGRSFKS